MPSTDIVVAGGGPVGLMLGNLAARQGLSVVVLERDPIPSNSRVAIGVSVPTLEILRTLGLADAVIEQGVPVRRLFFHGPGCSLGQLSFSEPGSSIDFLLAIPQDRVVRVLEESLARSPTARMERGCLATGFRSESEGIVVMARRAGRLVEYPAAYAVACDSGSSVLRESAGIAFDGGAYRHTFVMGDFEDRTGWGADAHVFFTPLGSVESFPLPGGLRRYVLPSPPTPRESAQAYLLEHVPRRCGVDLSTSRAEWDFVFGVRRHLARCYRSGRLLLAGDAAHLMSPVVGQNMNTGFADAEFLALALRRVLREGGSPDAWFGAYERLRRRAARVAARRAESMMRMGTSGGRIWSPVRNAIVHVALRSPARRRLARLFAMRSIPHANLTALSAEGVVLP